MATEKQRVTLYLNQDTYSKAKALVKRLPGLTVSALVEDLLSDAVTSVSALLDRAESGDKSAQASVFDLVMATQVRDWIGKGVGIVRTIPYAYGHESKSGEEDEQAKTEEDSSEEK